MTSGFEARAQKGHPACVTVAADVPTARAVPSHTTSPPSSGSAPPGTAGPPPRRGGLGGARTRTPAVSERRRRGGDRQRPARPLSGRPAPRLRYAPGLGLGLALGLGRGRGYARSAAPLVVSACPLGRPPACRAWRRRCSPCAGGEAAPPARALRERGRAAGSRGRPGRPRWGPGCEAGAMS